GKIMPTTRPGGLSSPFLRILGIAAACSCATVSLDAHAYQPGMGGGMSPPPSPGQKKEKKEGPAEEAPEDKEALRPIEVVPAQPARLRRVQSFELDGYLRVRSDYFHRLNLGLPTTSAPDAEPTRFFSPPAETPESTSNDGSNGDRMFEGTNDAACINRLTGNGVSATQAG